MLPSSSENGMPTLEKYKSGLWSAPDKHISLWLSIGTNLSSSCLMVIICCVALVSPATRTKSFPLIPIKYSMMGTAAADYAVCLLCIAFRSSGCSSVSANGHTCPAGDASLTEHRLQLTECMLSAPSPKSQALLKKVSNFQIAFEMQSCVLGNILLQR